MINKVLFVGRGGCPERNTAELRWHRINEGYGFHTFRTVDDVSRQVTSLATGVPRVSPLERPLVLSCSARPRAVCAAVEVFSGFVMLEVVGRHL